MFGGQRQRFLFRRRADCRHLGRFPFDRGTLHCQLTGALLFLAAGDCCGSRLCFGLRTLTRFFGEARFGREPGTRLHIRLVFSFDAGDGRILQLALNLDSRFGHCAYPLFRITPRLCGHCGKAFDVRSAGRRFFQFQVGIQPQAQCLQRTALRFAARMRDRFLLLFDQRTRTRIFARTDFGRRTVQRGFQCDFFCAFAFGCQVHCLLASCGQQLRILARFALAAFAFPADFRQTRFGPDPCFGFFASGISRGDAFDRLTACQFGFPCKALGGFTDAYSEIGFDLDLFDRSLARLVLRLGTLDGKTPCFGVRVGACAQFGDFLVDCDRACFACHARLALCLQARTTQCNGFLGGSGIPVGFRGGGGVRFCAVFGQRTGACFGHGAIFCSDRGLRFSFDAGNGFTYRFQVDAGIFPCSASLYARAVIDDVVASEWRIVAQRLFHIHAGLPLDERFRHAGRRGLCRNSVGCTAKAMIGAAAVQCFLAWRLSIGNGKSRFTTRLSKYYRDRARKSVLKKRGKWQPFRQYGNDNGCVTALLTCISGKEFQASMLALALPSSLRIARKRSILNGLTRK